MVDAETGGCWTSAFTTGAKSDSVFKGKVIAP
jgi:hypothetical protein